MAFENNSYNNTLNTMPGNCPPPSRDPRRSGRGPIKRPPTPNEQSGRHFMKEGIKGFFINLAVAAVVFLINFFILKIFKWNPWSLYWTNLGLVVILPIFNHFNSIEVAVYDGRTGQYLRTDTLGCRGIVIGLIVLGVITWLIFGLADFIFPPYNYMETFILIAAPTVISGGFILNRIHDMCDHVKVYLAGRRLTKDATAPRVQAVIEKNGEVRARISKITTIAAVAIFVLAFIGQYVQVFFVTQKSHATLDTLAVYRTVEGALPLPDKALTDLDGEFSEFSTRFATSAKGDLTYHGVTGHYIAYISYHYDVGEGRWSASHSSIDVTNITAADVKGTWSSTLCQDNAKGRKNFGIVLEVAEMTTEKVRGTIRFKEGDAQIHESAFEGTVVTENGFLAAEATMENPYAVFFDDGYSALSFKYQIVDDSFAFTGDFQGVLEKE